MSRENDERDLNFLRYQEVAADNVARDAERLLSSKRVVRREVRQQAKEEKRRGRR